jgi:aspartyl-tRNA synthetase
MSEFLGGWKRTNYCANFTKADAGKEVTLMGWANVRRDLAHWCLCSCATARG